MEVGKQHQVDLHWNVGSHGDTVPLSLPAFSALTVVLVELADYHLPTCFCLDLKDLSPFSHTK